MNRGEFVQALLAGKELISTDIHASSTNYVFHLHERGIHVTAKARSHGDLDYVVPYSYFRIVEDSQANPHRYGTFAWAGFEYAVGVAVRRPKHENPYEPGEPWAQRMFRGEDFMATDWRAA